MIKWNDINEVEPELNRNILVKFSKSYLDTIPSPKDWNMPSYYVLYKDTNGEYTEAAGEEYAQWYKEHISYWIYLEDLEN